MLPTSTDVTVQLKSQAPNDADAVVVFATQDTKAVQQVAADLAPEAGRAVDRLIRAGVVRGKAKELAFDLIESAKGKTRRVFVAGLGDARKVTAETVRQAVGAIVRAARKHRLQAIAIVPPTVGDVPVEAATDAIDRITADYSTHCTSAREIAREYLDAPKLLGRVATELGL